MGDPRHGNLIRGKRMNRFSAPILLAACAAIACAADSSPAPTTSPTTVATTAPMTAPEVPPDMEHDVWTDIAGGKLMLRAFDAAPYPHASRDAGYKSSSGQFPRDPHYTNSTVGIFVPPGYVAGDRVDYVLHFHGHKNHVANVVTKYKLLDQTAASKANAILIVPQGPWMAPDSGGGKLELDDDGFKRFIAEITQYLKDQKIIESDRVGHITLMAHSGGYKVTAAILHRGGMNDHIRDVILLDASYGSLGWFADFMKHYPTSRLVSFHTKHLDDENLELQKLMDAQQVPWRVIEEDKLDRATASQRGASFISTKLTHDAVSTERSYFQLALETADQRDK